MKFNESSVIAYLSRHMSVNSVFLMLIFTCKELCIKILIKHGKVFGLLQFPSGKIRECNDKCILLLKSPISHLFPTLVNCLSHLYSFSVNGAALITVPQEKEPHGAKVTTTGFVWPLAATLNRWPGREVIQS